MDEKKYDGSTNRSPRETPREPPAHPTEPQAIMNVQRYLRQLSYTDSRIPTVPVDGVVGEDTRRAIAEFQRSVGLPVTGTADPETFRILYNTYLQDVAAQHVPEPVYLFPAYPVNYTIGPGDTGVLIQVIQLLLRDLLLSYGQETNNFRVDGAYDDSTAAAVRSFQTIHQLPRNGRVDRPTWNHLARNYSQNGVNRFPKE